MVLGEEKRAKPSPRSERLSTTCTRGVISPRRARERSPAEVRAIPAEATSCGSVLSDHLPARGEKRVWKRGCTISTAPASLGERERGCCR